MSRGFTRARALANSCEKNTSHNTEAGLAQAQAQVAKLQHPARRYMISLNTQGSLDSLLAFLSAK